MGFEELMKDLKNGIGMVRVNAAAELGKLKDKRAEKSLIEALGDENLAVRNNAAFALGELGSKDAVPRLLALIHDPEERVRKSAIKALGMIGAHEAVAPLVHLLENNASHVVCKSAIRSLGQIGGPRSLQAVERFVNHADAVLSDMAKKSVEKMGKR